MQGLGVSRRFLEQCIRDRVFKEDRDISQVLEVRQGVRVKDFLWKDDCVEGNQNPRLLLAELTVCFSVVEQPYLDCRHQYCLLPYRRRSR